MWPRIIRALLCAATTRAAAATSHVVDDFNTTEGMFTLTSQVPPVSTTEVTETNAGVRLDYSSHHLEMYSGFPYAGRLLGDGTYPCAEASYLKLEYRILQAPQRPGVAHFVVAVGDASECGLDAPLSLTVFVCLNPIPRASVPSARFFFDGEGSQELAPAF